MMLRKSSKWIIVIGLILICLVACKKQDDTKKKTAVLNTVTAKMQSVPTQLFYSGNVSPIQVFNITSPVDAVVQKINFKYGDQVKTNQELLIISSSKLEEDYRTSLTNFLKAKQDYLNSTVNFQGAQELMKAQIISEQDFTSEKSQYENMAVAYLNAKFDLQQKIRNIPGLNMQPESLSLDDIQTITNILQAHYDTLSVKATHDGIILTPSKSGGDSSDSDSSSGKKLDVGSQIKQGQVLVTIGDLSGIATSVQVSELVIDKIKAGQPVTVTVEALPDVTLNGFVQAVSAEAQAAPGGADTGLAMFPVVINVPKLTNAQMQLLRVGMSAKVQITIQNPPQILLPINAVTQKNGVNVVTIIDPKTNQPKQVTVTTGPTTLDQVTIIQGVNPGDKVVIP